MEARRLDNGNLLVPVAVEGPGGALLDGMFEIGPNHPDHEGWLPFIDETGTRDKDPPADRPGRPNPKAR